MDHISAATHHTTDNIIIPMGHPHPPSDYVLKSECHDGHITDTSHKSIFEPIPMSTHTVSDNDIHDGHHTSLFKKCVVGGVIGGTIGATAGPIGAIVGAGDGCAKGIVAGGLSTLIDKGYSAIHHSHSTDMSRPTLIDYQHKHHHHKHHHHKHHHHKHHHHKHHHHGFHLPEGMRISFGVDHSHGITNYNGGISLDGLSTSNYSTGVSTGSDITSSFFSSIP